MRKPSALSHVTYPPVTARIRTLER